ncbi:MFS transporter [Mycobacterium asiaticum]|uniref:hypothetical protein n=1 Tax=Mycobacterium asiaticum TaxID=1790 RepID=UPI00055D1A86|nr:hypothetical protein [Mycobacterium asiaticum]ORA16195.1 hypothetical protein BST16_07840 [Mycobacterium asiaticum DSM 44297]
MYGCLAGGILLTVIFGFVELGRKHPLLDIRVFRRPDMLTGSIGMTTLLGICNAPSTTAITGAVPLSKQGVASAINDTTREVGGALGIALAGSILAAGYNHALVSSIAALPPTIRNPALGSLAQALTIADRMGPQGRDLSRHAKDAFMLAMHSSLLMLGTAVLISAAAVVIYGPRTRRTTTANHPALH